MNYREKIIEKNLKVCEENLEHLDDWEKGFYSSMQEKVEEEYELSVPEFNKLQEITRRF